MIALEDILTPAQVKLDLQATSRGEAVEHLLDLLRGDHRITNWQMFHDAIFEREAPMIQQHNCGIYIAHGRSTATKSLILAAGRLKPPILGAEPLHLVFVAGIPTALDTEYLRMVGLIARTCQDKSELHHLLQVAEPKKFISILSGNK